MRKGINIYKRKDGRWEGRYKVFINETSEYKYCSIYAKSYKEAREKLESCKAENITPCTKCDLTVKNLFELWLESIKSNVKDSTYANYAFKLEKHVFPELGNIKYEKINEIKINDFIKNLLNKGLSEKYIKDILSLLKSLGKYASKVHNYNNFYTDKIMIIKPKVKEIACYTKIIQMQLLNCILENLNLLTIGILLSYYTGIRIGELCALQWEDIDFDERCIHVDKTLQRIYDFDNPTSDKKTKIIITEPKSDKSKRIIPIPDFLCEILLKHKSDNNHYVLRGCEKYVEPRLLQYHFSSFLKKEKLPPINFHTLRHMFASNSIELGFDVKSLSEILGHSNVEITLNRYVHTNIERKRLLMDMHKLIS